jgi:hypothetical protein
MSDGEPAAPPAAAAGESPPVGAPRSRVPRVTLRFRVPYATVWGENLVLCGDDDRLGAWEPARGSWMQCTHVGDELIWQARRGTRSAGVQRVSAARERAHMRRALRQPRNCCADAARHARQALVTVHGLASFQYRYCVVDEQARPARGRGGNSARRTPFSARLGAPSRLALPAPRCDASPSRAASVVPCAARDLGCCGGLIKPGCEKRYGADSAASPFSAGGASPGVPHAPPHAAARPAGRRAC